MYFPATRLLTILELLQSRQRLSGPELADRLEVNTRTVRRYIMMLQDLGFPIEAERGRHGYYRLRPGYKLPPLMFTEDEALALTLALLMTRRLGLAAAAPSIEGALAKVERVLPVPVLERVRAVQDTLNFALPNTGITPSSEVLLTLAMAAQQERQATICYSSWQGEATERQVDVYGLVYRVGYWYAVGYCHLRQDLRVFRLDRIRSAEAGTTTFTRPSDFDCVEYVLRSLATTPATWEIEVLLELSMDEARQYISPAVALLEEAPGGVLLTCSVGHLSWIARYLVSLDCPFVVRRPLELRDELRKLARRIVELAGQEEPA